MSLNGSASLPAGNKLFDNIIAERSYDILYLCIDGPQEAEREGSTEFNGFVPAYTLSCGLFRKNVSFSVAKDSHIVRHNGVKITARTTEHTLRSLWISSHDFFLVFRILFPLEWSKFKPLCRVPKSVVIHSTVQWLVFNIRFSDLSRLKVDLLIYHFGFGDFGIHMKVFNLRYSWEVHF